MRTHQVRGRLFALALVLLASAATMIGGQSNQLPGLRHYTGQNVAPVYEGWEKNADGTFSLVFGYLNRNYEEEPEIAVGPGNGFAPGPIDRGQPTHFYPRRQQFMFKVRVPADFGGQELVWTVTRAGRTDKAVGHLPLEWELTENVYSQNRNGLARDSVTRLPNRPPTIAVDGPAQLTGVVGESVMLGVTASDDGIPKPPAPPAPPTGGRGRGAAEPPIVTVREGPNQQAVVKPSRTGLAVTWIHWRGPGRVTFEPPTMVVKDGKAATRARFGEPGTYVIRAYADDGVMMEPADVTVTVGAATKTAGQP